MPPDVLSPQDKILHLRQLLAERFGSAPQLAPSATYLTGLPALDDVGVPAASLTELVSSPAAGPGGGLLLYGLLHARLAHGDRLALIDGRDCFQPQALPEDDLARLLWLRNHTAAEALKSADLLVRDGNLPLVILFLTLNAPAELRRIPSSAWHRLQMVAEKTAVTLLVFTPSVQVGCARLRLEVRGAFPLAKLHRCRAELLPTLQLELARRRLPVERNHEELCRASCA